MKGHWDNSVTEPLVVVVILHFNRLEDTLECLESLSKNDYKNFKTIVLDFYFVKRGHGCHSPTVS